MLYEEKRKCKQNHKKTIKKARNYKKKIKPIYKLQLSQRGN